MSSRSPRGPRLPKYRRRKTKNRPAVAVVTIDGKDFYLGQYGTEASKQKYDSLIAEYLKQRNLPNDSSNGKVLPQPHPQQMLSKKSSEHITVVEACDKYLSHILAKPQQQQSGPKPELAHVKSMLSVLLGLYECERTAAIGPAELREARRAMIARGWSRNYVNEQVSRVKRFYKWLAAEPLIPITVYQALLVVDGLRRGEEGVRETAPVRVVDAKTVDATLLKLPEVVADMVRLQRLTGMRPAEVCLLRPCDLKRESDVWMYQPQKHKTEHLGRERVIFIGPQAQAILTLKYFARDAESYCFQPRDSEAKRLRVRATRVRASVGARYTTTAYRRAIHRAADKAGVPRWSPNRLRHSAATRIRREFGLEAAQIVLGHSKADVTQIYAERDLAKGIEVARRIG